jgi:chorismate mutase
MHKVFLDIQRVKIDNVNLELLMILKKRFEILEEIKKIKKTLKLPLRDLERLHVMLDTINKQSKQLEISPEMTKQIFEIIHSYSVDYLCN